MKTCPKCQQSKPLEEFVKDKRRKDGHGTYCLLCVREYANALYQRPDQKQAKQKYYEEHCTELNAQSRQRYATNKDRYRIAMDRWAEENRDSMLAYYRQKWSDYRDFTDTIKSKPCVDCGKSFPPCVMEYDHVRGSKRWALGKMSNHRREAVSEELAKCELVCCACHRIRSHTRRGDSKIPKVQEFRLWLNAIKSNPCTDCGLTLHHTAMDFDHVRGEKASEVSQMWSWGRHRVIEEIAKCELVCANCHRIRTQFRRDVDRSVRQDNLSTEETPK
jgi:hypothetical protein